MSRMFLWIGVGCLVIAGVASCTGEGGPKDAGPPPWARVASVTGDVEVKEKITSPWHPALVDTALSAESTLRTGPTGQARIEFRDGRKLDLQPGSQLALSGAGNDAELQLEQGEVVLDSVADGGGFRIVFGEAREVVRLQSGQARLRKVEGGELEVKAEEGAAPGFKLMFGDDSSVVVSRDGNAVIGSGGSVRMVMGEATLERGGESTALRVGSSFQMKLGKGAEVKRVEIATRAKDGEGKLRLKAPGSADFSVVAQDSPPLQAGTVLRSPGTFNLDDDLGSQVEVGARSEVVFSGSFRAGGVREGALRLEAGQARVRLQRGEAADVAYAIETAHAKVRARAQGGVADVQVLRKADATTIEVRAGLAEVRTATETITLAAGESLSVDAKGKAGKVLRDLMPRIVALEGAHTQVFYDRWIPKVAFAVSRAEDGAQATLEVGPNATFAKVWAREPVSGGFLAQNARAGRSYFRVLRAASGQPKPQPGPVGILELTPDPLAREGRASSVGNVVPDTGVQTKILFQGQVPELTFQWEAMEGAASYKFRVYTEDDLETAHLEVSTSDRRVVLAPGRLREGIYYWYQTALDASGKQLKANQMNKLVLAFDNAATLMRIDSPRPGQRPVDGRIDLRGRAPVGASVSVNNKEILVADDGRFEQVLSGIAPGTMLLFQLKRPGQGPVYYTRHLGR